MRPHADRTSHPAAKMMRGTPRGETVFGAIYLSGVAALTVGGANLPRALSSWWA
jgi:hypothetical protein